METKRLYQRGDKVLHITKLIPMQIHTGKCQTQMEILVNSRTLL